MMVCTVCKLEQRDALDRALLLGVPSRAIASRYGLEKSAVNRHRKCIRELVTGADRRRVGRVLRKVENLVDGLEELPQQQ